MRALLAAITLVLLGFHALEIRQAVSRLWRPDTEAVLDFRVGAPWPSVRAVGSAPAAAGMRQGDRVVAIAGQAFDGRAQLDRALAARFPGDELAVTVKSPGGTEREVRWRLRGAEARTVDWTRWLFVGVTEIGIPLLCLLVGVWTVALRPHERAAWLLLLMMASFSFAFGGAEWPEVPLPALMLRQGLALAWPLGMALFAWYFPSPPPMDAESPWMKYLLLLPGAGLIVLFLLLQAWTYSDSLRSAAGIDRLLGFTGWRLPVEIGTVSLFFAVLGWKTSLFRTGDQRRRIRTILVGSAVAMTPTLLVLLGRIFFGWENELALSASLLMTVGFPLTLGYVVVVQRAFGVGVVVRQGLQYALAHRGVQYLQIGISVALVFMVLKLAEDPGNNRPRIIQLVAGGITGVLLLRRGAMTAQAAVDRRFFRQAVDTERLLSTLGDDVRKIGDGEELAETVARRLGEAMQVERVRVVREGVPAGLWEVMGKRVSARVYWEEKGSWLLAAPMSEADREWLRAEGAELVLAVGGREGLAGLLVMGPRRSEEPYSKRDTQLLESVATQTGMALENARLTTSMAQEVAQRMILSREVEIAREVQERLFPQRLPAVPRLEYAGFCRPALGIGGDYYDFLPLEGGRLGVAIGDVSGKGIPAALLMASLQASLRGQTMAGNRDLASLMANLNRLIFDLSPSNRYATFFYGEFEPATGLFRYVNGGHNAPMILRGEEWIRLETGGPVVGLFGPAKYAEGAVKLETGDLLVGFTDGISEAMNGAEEEWGEEALADYVKARRSEEVGALIPEIMAGADAFAAGAPQHDDMTLVVLRVLD